MSDLISRKAAIDAVHKNYDVILDFTSDGQTISSSIEDILSELPPAQPERKKGTWIIKDNPGTGWYRVTCSECGEDVTSTAPYIGFYPNAKVTWDYCPNCGADMRKDEQE